jgi:hypothetical protein
VEPSNLVADVRQLQPIAHQLLLAATTGIVKTNFTSFQALFQELDDLCVLEPRSSQLNALGSFTFAAQLNSASITSRNSY